MLTKYKHYWHTIRERRIIYIILVSSIVSEKLFRLNSLIRQNRLIRQISSISLIRIIEDTLAAISIFVIAFAWLIVARGLGWH